MMKEEDIAIEVKGSKDDSAMVDVSVVNNTTGTRTEFPPLTEIQLGRSGIFKYANGALFAVHTSGDNAGDLSKGGWKDYLWRHETQGSGTKLLEGRGIQFVVSTDARFILATSDDEVLIMRDGKVVIAKTKASFALTGGNTQFNLYPIAVGPKTSWLSFSTAENPVLQSLLRVDHTSGAIERVDIANLNIRGAFDVEPERGRLLYADRPYTQDAERNAELDKEPSALWVFDTKTKKTEQVAKLAPGEQVAILFWEDERNIFYRLMSEEKGRTVTVQ